MKSFEVRAMRSACTVKIAETQIEIALDEGSIEAHGRSLPLCEIEFECKIRRPTPGISMGRSWFAPGGLWLNSLSKAERGSNLNSGQTVGPPSKACAPRIDGIEDGRQLLSVVLQSTLKQVLANAGDIALGGDDEEHLHQLRVGLRRTRTALRELCPPGMVLNEGWEPTLADAFTSSASFETTRPSRRSRSRASNAPARRRLNGIHHVNAAQHWRWSRSRICKRYCSTSWNSPTSVDLAPRRPSRRK